MEKISAVRYHTSDGILTVTFDRPEWVLEVGGDEQRFESVPAWLGHIRETYGWPLASAGTVD